jgi:S1-C subfamily serine protease
VFDTTGHVVGVVGQLAFGTHSYAIWDYDGDVAHEATAINLVKLTVTGVTSVPAPYAGHRAYLGLAGEWMSSKVAQALGEHRGDLVEEVMIGSPADRAGIRSGTMSATAEGGPYRTGGDVIVAVDGVQLTQEVQVGNVISRLRPGDVIPVRLWRDDRLITVRVKLANVP